MPPAQRKMVKTYLDEIPNGNEEFQKQEMQKTRKERKVLTDGATDRILCKDVIRIAWPSLLELTLTSLVSMVDMMMVGSMANGTAAISSVSLATQPRFIFMTLLMSLNTGATAVVARARGRGEHDKANNILKQALTFSLFLTILSSIAGFCLAEPLIRLMAGSGMAESTVAGGVTYLRIQMAGFFTLSLTLCITASLRGTGNSRVPMVYNMTANIVNVIFNWLLINGNLGFPAMGVAGASLATVIGQTVALCIAIYSITCGKYYFKIRIREKFRLNFKIIGAIAKIGVPALIEQGIMRIGMIIFARQVSSLGEIDFATHNVCMNIQSLSFNNGQAFAVSATTLVGQSLGKWRSDFAEHYSRRCRRLGLYVSLFLMLVFAFFGKYIVMLYNDDPAVLASGARIMILVAIMQPIQCSQFILSGCLRGAGDTKATAVITLCTVMILRPVLGYLFINVLEIGVIGAWIAIFCDQSLRSFMVMMRYNSGKWKNVRVNV